MQAKEVDQVWGVSEGVVLETVTQPCACHMLLRTGEVADSRHGANPIDDIARISFCNGHAAAPALLAALEGLLGAFEATAAAGRSGVSPTQAIAQRDAARAAIAKARGGK